MGKGCEVVSVSWWKKASRLAPLGNFFFGICGSASLAARARRRVWVRGKAVWGAKSLWWICAELPTPLPIWLFSPVTLGDSSLGGHHSCHGDSDQLLRGPFDSRDVYVFRS